MVLVAADWIEYPGADTSGLMRPSRVGPRLELGTSKNPPLLEAAMLPTVSASVAAPGLQIVHVPGPALPAATATTSPAAWAALTACEGASVPALHPAVPRDILTTSMP